MDFQKLLAEAELITDPVAREAEINRIMSMMLGSPAKAATADPVAAYRPLSPTAPVEVSDEDLAALQQDVGLSQKLNKIDRIEALTDDELDKIINGFGGPVTPEVAQEELLTRKAIDEGSILNPAYLERLAGNVVAGAAEIPTSGPVALAGLLGKGGELLVGKDKLGADKLLQFSGQIRDDIRANVGISEERDIGESLAGLVPSVIPIGGKAPTSFLGNVLELVTPFVVGSGTKRVAANFVTSAVAEQAIREATDTPDSEYETAFDKLGLGTEEQYFGAVDTFLGGMGLLMGTSIVVPAAIKAMRSTKAVKTPTVVDINKLDVSAPKNLQTLETAGDLYKTYFVDEKTVLSDLAKRARVPDPDRIASMIDTDTQMAANMRVNEALRTGRLRTNGGTFEVSVPPDVLYSQYRRLPPAIQSDADAYLKYRDLTDDLNIRIKKGIDVDVSKQLLQDANAQIFAIEQRNPIVKDLAAKYQEVTGGVRKFLSQGPNAMLSEKALQNLDIERRNYVPMDISAINPNQNLLERIADATTFIDQQKVDDWYLQHRSLEAITDISNRANSFEVLRDYTHNALKTKMEQDVRGAYIRAMQESEFGGDTIRPLGKDEIGKYGDRALAVYESGKKKTYLSSKLQRELLQFDPYVAKFPLLYAGKRMFEHGTTGPLSVTFAPVSALRDSLAGWVFTPKGQEGPTATGVVAAVPKQIWAKTQRAVVDILESGMDLPFIDDAGKKALSQQISNSYMNSIYHLANEAGGFDASLMKTNIENARGVMAELARSASGTAANVPGLNTLGHSLAAMYRGWANIFNSIQEAPRFSAFENNVKAGMDPARAVTEARKLTGDTTRSGRVYNPRGIRIDADAVNKGAKAPAAAIGTVTELARETTPYFNPMVQGMRRMGNAFIDDPVRTNLRAWGAVGIPAMAALGWNEMLGEEYNRFAFSERSSRDIAMNMYIGIPGLPPEQGIQIPIAHELAMFKSPFETGLYSLMQGSDSDEVKQMMMHMAGTSLTSSAMIGYPVALQQSMNLSGYKAPESILTPMSDTYALREDNVGLLPQNVEMLVRNSFGSISDLVLNSAAASYEGGPEAFFEELGHQILRRTPVAKNVAGTTTPVTAFTPLDTFTKEKVRSVNGFLRLWTDHFDPDREGKIRKSTPADTKGLVDDNDAQTTANFAPLPTTKPTNPIFEEYGAMIKQTLDGNSEGYTALESRQAILAEQLRYLRAYNAGRKDQFRMWQKSYEGADERYQQALRGLEVQKPALNKKEYNDALKAINGDLQEKAKADRLVKELKLDLSKRSDVIKLISTLERERRELLNQQMSLIKRVEDRITEDLRMKGMIGPKQKFEVEKHLSPNLVQF